MSQDLPIFPRGTVAMGSGDLTQVTTFKIKITNGAKLKHSLRKSPSGVTFGHREVSGSFDVEVPEAGEERDYWEMVAAGTIKTLRIKIPGRTLAVTIATSDIEMELPSDDAIKQTVSYVGILTRAK